MGAVKVIVIAGPACSGRKRMLPGKANAFAGTGAATFEQGQVEGFIISGKVHAKIGR